jgi:excisionase family DNA binding protein
VKLLSVREAAEALGVSAALIYTLCARRRLRHERHGLGRGTIRIPQEGLEAYRQSVTVEAEGGAASVPPSPKMRLKHLDV